MFTRSPGQPSQRPFYFAALAAAQNVGGANGGILLGASATNEGASVAYLTIADASGALYKIAVPAASTVPLRALNDGREYTGQLTITPSAALDVTVELA